MAELTSLFLLLSPTQTSGMIGAHVCQKLHDLACVPLFTILHTSTLHPTISAYRLASPPTPTSVFLRRYASILNSQKQLANRPDASPQASGHAVALAGALHFCYWTAGFLKKRWSETEIRNKIVATGVASLPWISCEALKMGGCRQLGEQEVMMVCSRVSLRLLLSDAGEGREGEGKERESSDAKEKAHLPSLFSSASFLLSASPYGTAARVRTNTPLFIFSSPPDLKADLLSSFPSPSRPPTRPLESPQTHVLQARLVDLARHSTCILHLP